MNGIVEIRAVYNLMGVDIGDKKDVLGLYSSENEGAKFWFNVLTDMKLLESLGFRKCRLI